MRFSSLLNICLIIFQYTKMVQNVQIVAPAVGHLYKVLYLYISLFNSAKQILCINYKNNENCKNSAT